MIYAKTIVTGPNRFYRGHFQNAPNIKTFFGYALAYITSCNDAELMKKLNRIELNCDVNLSLQSVRIFEIIRKSDQSDWLTNPIGHYFILHNTIRKGH